MVLPLKNCSGDCAAAGMAAAAIRPAARIATKLMVLLGMFPPWNAGLCGRACIHNAGMCAAMPLRSGGIKPPRRHVAARGLFRDTAFSGRLRDLAVEGQSAHAGRDRHALALLDAAGEDHFG